MDIYTTKISIEPYLAEFLMGLFGLKDDKGQPTGIVNLSEATYLHDTIWTFMQTAPRNAPKIVPNIQIKLPHYRKGQRKDPAYYNYISIVGAHTFNRLAKKFFRARLHEYIDEKKGDEGFTYKESCYMFVAEFNINSIDPDSLVKNHSRWRGRVAQQRKKAYASR